MFNKNKTIGEQSNTIRDLKETVRTWIKANNLAQVAFDTQSKLVDVLNETIELHEEIKKQDEERNQQNEEIIKLLEETIELYKQNDKLKDKRIVQLLEQNIGMMK